MSTLTRSVKECSLSLQTKTTIKEKGRLFTLTRYYCTHICKEIHALTSAFYKVRLYGDVAFPCLVDDAGFPEVDTPPPFEGYIEPHIAGGAGRVLLEEFKCFDNLWSEYENNNNTGYLYSAVHRSITALAIYKQKEKTKYKQNFNIKKNTIR